MPTGGICDGVPRLFRGFFARLMSPIFGFLENCLEESHLLLLRSQDLIDWLPAERTLDAALDEYSADIPGRRFPVCDAGRPFTDDGLKLKCRAWV